MMYAMLHEVVFLRTELCCCRNGRIVGVVTGNIILFAMGTGNYDELICMFMILGPWNDAVLP